jgi:hypothetical protein
VTVYPELLEEKTCPDMPCVIFGPTCDGFDVILEKYTMPELDEDDWLLWRNMGAYTSAAGSTFNGFEKAVPWYYRTQKFPRKLSELCEAATSFEERKSSISTTDSTSTLSAELDSSPSSFVQDE